jgi:hypothetical protein
MSTNVLSSNGISTTNRVDPDDFGSFWSLAIIVATSLQFHLIPAVDATVLMVTCSHMLSICGRFDAFVGTIAAPRRCRASKLQPVIHAPSRTFNSPRRHCIPSARSRSGRELCPTTCPDVCAGQRPFEEIVRTSRNLPFLELLFRLRRRRKHHGT